jgi:hypothetical protein
MITSTKRIGVLGTLAAILAGAICANAQAHPTAAADVACKEKRAVGTLTVTARSNGMIAHLSLAIDGTPVVTRTRAFGTAGATYHLSYALPRGRHTVTASVVVNDADPNTQEPRASASKSVKCNRSTPPPPPPPPPPDRATSARLIGPCGDPMYAAVFNNRGGSRAVTFHWRYHAFGVGYVTLDKTIAAGKVFRTGYKHVTGSTITTIRAHGETLVSERTAPPGDYPSCS